MRNKILLTLLVCVCASVAWAADWATTYEENYADATKAGVTSTVKSYTRKAHPCLEWSYLKVRIKNDTLPVGKQAIWLNRNHADVTDDVPCYIECANIEGGVKNISFLYKQAHSGDDGKIICLALKADDVRLDSIRFTGASGYRTKSSTYSKALGIKSNAKLTLQNISHEADANYTIIPGRLTIGALTITPYLLYRSKDVTIGTKQQGYVNRELLDNTGGTETITYLSSDETTATIDAVTGAVTPIKAGTVTIYASLDGGTTTITSYTLHIEDNIICENFSKVNQTGSASSGTSWNGDLFSWTVNKARRFTNDTIYDCPRIQGTWIAENDGNLQSTNAIEGGIKHIEFDWMQWTNVTSSTIKVIYGGVEKVVDAQTGISQFDHFSIDEDIDGTSNAVLKISNASPSSPADRVTLSSIKITPYLLYTNKTEQRMRVGDTYKRVPDIDNTGGESGTLQYISSDDDIATVASDGTVTAKAGGKVTITAKYKWTESEYITTTYPVQIWPVKCETFDEITQTGNYNNTTPRVGDKATWTTSLGGFNVGDFSAYTINLARFRAPYQDSGEEAYIESSYISGGISSLSFKWNVGGSESTTNWDIRVLINGRQVKKLVTAASSPQAEFGTVTIDDIDEPGKFSIRFENHSTISDTYTSGNKGRFVIDDVTWTSYDGPIELDETADNSAILSRNNGVKLDVDITRSNLVGGVYNTLCLPFSISKSDLGEGVDVQELTSASQDGDVLTVGFSALDGETLTAGTPYLVKPASNVSLTSFTDKTLISMPSTINQGAISLVGIFSPYAMTGGDKTTLFVGTPDGEGNNLFYPAADGSLKGFRAYFKLNTAMSSHSTPRVARFVVNQNRMPTGIEDVNGESARGEWKKVIRNGQLFIEHDGSVYTVTGQKAE